VSCAGGKRESACAHELLRSVCVCCANARARRERAGGGTGGRRGEEALEVERWSRPRRAASRLSRLEKRLR